MTPDAYFTPLQGQSLLYPGQAEKYRGQCVQSVQLWLRDTGTPPPEYLYAYQYYDKGIPGYTKVPFGSPILMGDIVVWGDNFPSSPGAGHIDVAAQDGDANNFWAWDSNWEPPLKLSKIHHNGQANKYIVGYLRKDNGMTKEQAQELSLYLRLLDFESVDEANTHSEDDVSHMLADPGYAGALAKQIYSGQHWQECNYKVAHYDADVAAGFTPYTGPQLFSKKG